MFYVCLLKHGSQSTRCILVRLSFSYRKPLQMAPTEKAASQLALRKLQYFVCLCTIFFTELALELFSAITYSWEELLDIRAAVTHQNYQHHEDYELEQILCLLSLEQLNLFQRLTQNNADGGEVLRVVFWSNLGSMYTTHHSRVFYSLMSNRWIIKLTSSRRELLFRETPGIVTYSASLKYGSQDILSDSIKPVGFSKHRANRNKHLSGKQKGGGICFMTNDLRCNCDNIQEFKSFQTRISHNQMPTVLSPEGIYINNSHSRLYPPLKQIPRRPLKNFNGLYANWKPHILRLHFL